MNKKFLVGALLVALSTAGYAYDEVGSIGFGKYQIPNINDINNNFAAVQQDVNNINNSLAGKVDQGDFDSLKTQVSNNTAITTTNSQLIGNLTQNLDETNKEIDSVKGDVDFVKGEVERVEGEVTDLQNKVETGFDNLQNQVSGNSQALGELGQDIVDLNNKLEGYEDVKEEANSAIILGQENSNKIDDLYANKADKTEVENALANKADKEDVDFVKGEVERVENDVTGLQNKLEDYDEVKENANSAIILGQENSNKIDDLYANKADKTEVENALANKADKEDVDFVKGEVERVENDVTGLQNKLEDYDEVKENANSAIILGQENSNKIDDLYANKVDNSKFEEHKKQQEDKNDDQDKNIQSNKDAIAQETTDRINADNEIKEQVGKFQDQMNKYDGRLSGLEKKVDHLDDKMNKGLSLMAAMNAVDFQNVQTGEMALGAGVGHYGNAQSVALGVAYSPVEDLTVNAKYSVTAGDADSFAVGAGATYKFKVGR